MGMKRKGESRGKSAKSRRWRYLFLLAIPLAVVGTVGLFHGHFRAQAAAEPAASVSSSSPSSSPVSSPAPLTEKILKVPLIGQAESLPTGCELTSSMMLLKYYGYTTTADELVRRTPKCPLLSENHQTYGMNPNQAFIGDPRTSDGLGCYATVISAVVDSYFWDDGKYKTVNETGTDLEDLAHDYIDQNSPVLIWATVDMADPKAGQSWILADTNRTFQWISEEHCLVLVGYDEGRYYFNDPNDPGEVKSYDKNLVKKRYQALGKQAVAVQSILSAPPSPSPQKEGDDPT